MPTNRLVESLGLFAEVANSRWFENCCLILFLNKKDAFETKIKTIDLKSDGDSSTPPRFLDYQGAKGDSAEAIKYITGRFLELAQRKRPVTHHVTNCLDAKSVRVVVKACKEQIVRENLKHSGMGDD